MIDVLVPEWPGSRDRLHNERVGDNLALRSFKNERRYGLSKL